jgi:hypothetical protein
VNNKTIKEIDGVYFVEQGNDKVYLDTKFLTIKFKDGMETLGIQDVNNYYRLSLIGVSSGNYHIFKIDANSNPYPDIIRDLNTLTEVESTYISYIGSYMVKDIPDDPGSIYKSIVYNMWDSGAWYIG